MPADKKIDATDLPQQLGRATTQQPEEYIDKSNKEKDEHDHPRPPADDSGDVKRATGSSNS